MKELRDIKLPKMKKEKLFFIFTFFVLALIPLTTWFKGDYLIAGLDFIPPLRPLEEISVTRYLWDSLFGGTTIFPMKVFPYYSFFAFFQFLRLNILFVQKIWFIFVFLSPGLFMYYLALFLMPGERYRIGRIVASLFYMFNIATLHPFSDGAVLAYVFTPLLLGIFARGLKKKENKYAVLFSLSSLLLVTSAAGFPIYAIPWLIIGAYFVFHCLRVSKKQRRASIIFFIKAVGLTLFLNLWWIVSLLMPFIGSFALISESISLDWVVEKSINSSFLNVFRLLGRWSWNQGIYGHLFYPYAISYWRLPWLVITYFLTLLAFSALFFKSKNRKVLFFVILGLVSIFLAKGLHSPFGFINNFLYVYIPGFMIFREPITKFLPLIAFCYAVLIGFATNEIYNRLTIKKWRSRLLVGGIFIGLVILSILITAWPLITGDAVLPKRGLLPGYQVKIPSYWFKASEWMNAQEGDFKVLLSPQNPFVMVHYNWDFSGKDIAHRLVFKPLITIFPEGEYFRLQSTQVINLLYQTTQSFFASAKHFPKLLNLFDVKYILQRNDLDWTNFGATNVGSPKFMKAVFNSQEEIQLVESFGELDVYEVSDEHFLPHFYISQNIIYSPNNIEVLPDIVSFGDYKARSGVYVNESGERKVENRDLLKRAGEIFVKAELEDAISEEKLEVAAVPELVFFPYVKHKPGSLGWKLARLKEKFEEWRARQDIEKLIKKKLFYASKRISELEKWGEEENAEYLIQNIYKKKMEEVFEEIGELSDEERKKTLKIKLRTYWEEHREKFRNLESEKLGNWENVFREIDEKIKVLEEKTILEDLEYNLDIPQSGNYQLLIKNEEFGPYLRDDQLKLEFLGEKIAIPLVSENEEWISGVSFKLEKGERELSLVKPQTINLLRTGDWQNNLTESIFVKDKIISSAHLQQAFPEGSTIYFKLIENYRGETFYKITFDYLAFGGEAGIIVIENIGIEERILRIKEELSVRETEDSRHFERIFKSTPGAKIAEFYFWGKTEKDQDFNIRLFNLKIERVIEPTIIFYATQYQKPLQIPKITFLKINPTKYKVKVEGAKEPYTLVFSESFHEGWRAYVSDQRLVTSNQRAYVSDQRLVTSNQYGGIVASYFDGEIKEGTHQNLFLDRSTFETWGKEPIPEDKHFLVNGYANSWYITPEDADGQENYELIIEFYPQRLFYIGLGISLITFLGCLGYLGYDFAK